jgi:hypothetical protein
MFAATTPAAWPTEDFAAELTDAALRVAHRHGTTGASVDVELDLWRTLAGTLAAQKTAGSHLLGHLTDAAYRTLLGRGRGSFVDLELDLWQTFRAVCQARKPAPAARPRIVYPTAVAC